MSNSEFLRREWPGIFIWVVAIGLGFVAFDSFDPRSPFQHVLAASAVSVFSVSIAAFGQGVRQAAGRRRPRGSAQ